MLKQKKTIALLIILVIVIAGTIITLAKGFNYSLQLDNNINIKVVMNNKVEENDIKQVLKETFNNQKTKVQYLNETNNELIITVDSKEISEQEKNTLLEKLNIRFQEELTEESIEITNNIKSNLGELAKQYILPVLITTIIIVLYFVIKYRKIEIAKMIEYLVEGIALTQLVYFSIIAIARIPVGLWTMPVSILIYAISIIALTIIFNKEYEKISLKNNQKRK